MATKTTVRELKKSSLGDNQPERAGLLLDFSYVMGRQFLETVLAGKTKLTVKERKTLIDALDLLKKYFEKRI